MYCIMQSSQMDGDIHYYCTKFVIIANTIVNYNIKVDKCINKTFLQTAQS